MERMVVRQETEFVEVKWAVGVNANASDAAVVKFEVVMKVLSLEEMNELDTDVDDVALVAVVAVAFAVIGNGHAGAAGAGKADMMFDS